ncbi:MAG: histidine kinase [archaeon]|nr:histidine kinase [archaeon]
MARKNSRRILSSGVLISMLAMFLIGGYLLISKEGLVVPNYVLIPMTFDVIGMGMCIMLYLALYADRHNDLGSHHFILMTVEMFMIFFASIISWASEGDPSKNLFNEVGMFVAYEILLLTMLTFWLYIAYVIDAHDKRMKILHYLILAVFIIGVVATALNFRYHQFYTIDAGGFYTLASSVDLSLLAPILIIIFSNIAVTIYIKGLRKKMALFTIVLLPLTAAVVEMYFDTVELLYIVSFYSLLIIYGNFYVGRSEDLARKESELVKQRADILVSQIQPHFLYNALTSIMNIKGNPPDTMFAIADFGKYLRGNLDSLKQRAPIPITKEVDHVETFMLLEQLSIGKGLELELNINDRNFLIPALTLQKLVEKCVENGYSPSHPRGKIVITTEETESSHFITVEDDGTGFELSAIYDKDRAEIFGITTIEHRLKEQVDGSLDIESQIGVGTIITITIPKTKPKESHRFF